MPRAAIRVGPHRFLVSHHPKEQQCLWVIMHNRRPSGWCLARRQDGSPSRRMGWTLVKDGFSKTHPLRTTFFPTQRDAILSLASELLANSDDKRYLDQLVGGCGASRLPESSKEVLGNTYNQPFSDSPILTPIPRTPLPIGRGTVSTKDGVQPTSWLTPQGFREVLADWLIERSRFQIGRLPHRRRHHSNRGFNNAHLMFRGGPDDGPFLSEVQSHYGGRLRFRYDRDGRVSTHSLVIRSLSKILRLYEDTRATERVERATPNQLDHLALDLLHVQSAAVVVGHIPDHDYDDWPPDPTPSAEGRVVEAPV